MHATGVKFAMPERSGHKEIKNAITDIQIRAFFNPRDTLKKNITDKTSKTQLKIAVIRGAKLAYPNGIKLKYENVFLITVPSSAKLRTAPNGSISKKTASTDNAIKMILLFLFINSPPYIFMHRQAQIFF